jgi:hypothetical protein
MEALIKVIPQDSLEIEGFLRDMSDSIYLQLMLWADNKLPCSLGTQWRRT